MKEYKLGIIVGRFQVLHLGHTDMIQTAIELCERVGVFIGSSQESGTKKNPFDYEKRKEFLKLCFGDQIEVYPLPDIHVGNNAAWGDYVLSSAKEVLGETPDVFISGEESRRDSWFSEDEIKEVFIPKTIEISASQMTDFLLSDDKESWVQFIHPALTDKYEEYKNAALLYKDNLSTDSL